jgi:sirohydrochlorin cobaltochelatase
MKNGIFYCIGVGPGDPTLMTLKAIRTIEACDRIVLPAASREACYAYRIAEQVCPQLADKPFMCRPFPMIRDERELNRAHDQIYRDIEDELRQGQQVGLLTIGDPTIYSTGMYMHQRAREAGWQTEIISAVPSFCAAAARLGISLGEKDEEIHIIPASYDITETLSFRGTRIYMKSGKKLEELIAALRADAHTADCEIYAISNCGLPDERLYTGLDDLPSAADYLTLVIVKRRFQT